MDWEQGSGLLVSVGCATSLSYRLVLGSPCRALIRTLCIVTRRVSEEERISSLTRRVTVIRC